MTLLRRFATAALVALFLARLAMPNAHAVTIDWVTVGDPGNVADHTGFGAVAESFRIMKFEFTNQQYADFLNSVAKTTDPYSLYNQDMRRAAHGGIQQMNLVGSYRYSVKPNMGDKPVNFVSWFDAARVANWLMNGATDTSSTETGAYTLIGGQTRGTAPAVNPGATFYIPTQDEWYKAAYYKGGSTNAGYWEYATQSDKTPTKVSVSSTGDGGGSFGNFANYNPLPNYLWSGPTTVGTNGEPSAYGTFDMSGNVWEWNDLTGAAGSLREIRGQDWLSDILVTGGYGRSLSPSIESDYQLPNEDIGFRLASPVPVPEPSTYAMALAGLACGFSLWRRRRA